MGTHEDHLWTLQMNFPKVQEKSKFIALKSVGYKAALFFTEGSLNFLHYHKIVFIAVHG